MHADAAAIRKDIEQWAAAIRLGDINNVMSIYAPDILSFDVEAPLQYTGFEAKKNRWQATFAAYERILDYEIRGLTITSLSKLAFGHSLNRLHGVLSNGKESGFWLRWTPCFRKINDRWLIVHEQISAPVDPSSGKACLNLNP